MSRINLYMESFIEYILMFHYHIMLFLFAEIIIIFLGLNENYLTYHEISPDGKFIVFRGSYGYIHLISSKVKENLVCN